MNNDWSAVFDTPVGRLGIQMQGAALSRVGLFAESLGRPEPLSAETRRVRQTLLEYFEGGRDPGGLEISVNGTDFQRKVWQALREIPSGQVVSYGELAQRLGTSARAVGNACRNNPTPVVVPCHRVVAADGGPGGFAGDRSGKLVAAKRWLLAHEGVEIGR